MIRVGNQKRCLYHLKRALDLALSVITGSDSDKVSQGDYEKINRLLIESPDDFSTIQKKAREIIFNE